MNEYKLGIINIEICYRCENIIHRDDKMYIISTNERYIICELCEESYDAEYKKFLLNFIQPERSKRENL
jgi:hypothetical protein